MKSKYKLFLFWVSIGTAIGGAIYINSLFFFADETDIITDNIIPESIELKTPEDIDIVDIAIKNIIVYPNRSDQESIYIDIEIQNINGNETVQVSLSNANNLIGSDQISLKSNQKVYFQSFLLKDNIDFKSKFDVKISSLKLEDNIANNRYSFNVNLESDNPKIAIISGNLNFNSMAIINHVANDFDHFIPDFETGIHDFKDFWFKRYDLVIFDNFPNHIISDEWRELFVRKINSQNTALILSIGNNQNFDSLMKLSPLFGVKIDSKEDINNISKRTFFEKNQFKSVLINNANFYEDFFNEKNNYFEESLKWALENKKLHYNFFLGSEHYNINDKIFIYGFSNRVDLEKKIFTAKISIDDRYLYNKRLYFNPISDYYFSQFNIDNFGNYKIEIIDENDFILETISVNIVEELSKL